MHTCVIRDTLTEDKAGETLEEDAEDEDDADEEDSWGPLGREQRPAVKTGPACPGSVKLSQPGARGAEEESPGKDGP